MSREPQATTPETTTPETTDFFERARELGSNGDRMPNRLRMALLNLLELAKANRGDDESCGFGDTACEGVPGMRESAESLRLCRFLLDCLDADLIEARNEQLAYLRQSAQSLEGLELL